MNDTARKLNTSQREARAQVDGAEVHWVRHSDPREHWNKARIYVSVADFNLLEDLQNRTRRPYDVWRPRVLDVLRALGYNVCRGPVAGECDCGGLRIRWSQRAGCSCPCSPGFIIEDGFSQHLRGGGLYIKLTDAPSVDESKSPRTLAS